MLGLCLPNELVGLLGAESSGSYITTCILKQGSSC